MDVANLELGKKLFELSGWDETFLKWYEFVGSDFGLYSEPLVSNKSNNYRQKEGTYICPAYDLGYLLRKLYTLAPFIGFNLEARPDTHNDKRRYFAMILQEEIDVRIWSDTPENAACQVAIELFQQSVLNRQKVSSIGISGYT